MNIDKHLHVIEALAQGYDPITGEVFESDSPYNHPDVIRALWSIITLIKSSHIKPKLTLKQKQQSNTENNLPWYHMLPWSKEDKQKGKQMFYDQYSPHECATTLGRKASSIIAFWFKSDLINEQQRIDLMRSIKVS